MAMPDGAEQGSGEKDVADRAESDDEDIGAVGHGVKVQRERSRVNSYRREQ
jgi:hypothetical protein